MEILRDVSSAKSRCGELRRAGLDLGFVPTMGALHAGHVSLLNRARRENDRLVVSIFVNPTQYDDPDDLARYPRPFDSDVAACETAGADLVLAPTPGELYPDSYRFRVTEEPFSRELEGAHRAGHFDGVLTVVLKLLNIVRPHRAYFGAKDWQQLQLVQDMVAAFFLNTEIVPCATVREPDGLAMSSRNELLSAEERRQAPRLHQVLAAGGSEDEMTAKLLEAGFQVDYVSRRGDRVLAAVRLGEVRLIDNVQS